jgi:predicted amino acid dehydrogenase
VDTFAFIIHPIQPKKDVSRKFPLLGRALNEQQINFLSAYFPPVYISEVEGVRSQFNGREIKGWLLACPLTAARMLELPERVVYRKIIETGRMAERLGAQILGLGAFTSVVGDAGVTVANALDIPVTSGDAYTIAAAVQALFQAGEMVSIPTPQAAGAVVGASGAIGRVCAALLGQRVSDLYLVGRRPEALEPLCDWLRAQGCTARLHIASSLEALRQAHLVITVTSALHAVIQPENLLPGSVVCDVARPRDVSASAALARQDVLVIDGGMVETPGPGDFHFDFGYPPGAAYACMAETMALTLEGRFEDYTLGREISLQRVQEISAIAEKHGFRLSRLRSFDKEISPQQIELVRHQARLRF